MARKFLTHIDLSKNELQNAVVQNLAGAPSSPVRGQLYFNSTDSILYWYNGSGWVAAQGGAGAVPATTVTTQAVGDAPVVGVATTYAREDHKHGREAFGAVTAQTTFGAASANGAASSVARSDHTHGTPVHDAAAHSTIPLSALAVPTAAVAMNGFALTGLPPTPTGGTDATSKAYVDGLTLGLSWKDNVRAGTTANVALTGLQTVDGVALAANDRVLVKNQTAGAENGIYLAQSGAWTRATDADAASEILQASVFVSEGTTLADTAWTMTTNAPITLGSTALTWVQFGASTAYQAGAGLTLSANVIDVGAGSGILVAADAVSVDTSVIATAASVALKADKTVVNTAGAGLTGGGDLSANRSFDVGAGTGITVAADAVSLDTTYTDTRYVNAAGDTMTGPLVINDSLANITSAPGGNLRINAPAGQLVRLQTGDQTRFTVADTAITAGVPLWLSADPVGATEAATKQYVDGKAVKRFAQDIGGATAITVTHNLGTLDVIVGVYRKASPFDQIECDVEHTSTTVSTLRFSVAPAAAEYRAVVLA